VKIVMHHIPEVTGQTGVAYVVDDRGAVRIVDPAMADYADRDMDFDLPPEDRLLKFVNPVSYLRIEGPIDGTA
jgi:hypothetical protein